MKNRLIIVVLVASVVVSMATLGVVVMLAGRMQALEARTAVPTSPVDKPVVLPGYVPGEDTRARARPGIDRIPDNMPPGTVPTSTKPMGTPQPR